MTSPSRHDGISPGSWSTMGSSEAPLEAATFQLALPLLNGGLPQPQGLPQPAQQPTASAERPYHSKRPHKKSRTGCTNCKVRKVKCDEARPTCRSCRLRKVPCAYPSKPTPRATHPASPASSQAESDFSSPSSVVPARSQQSSVSSETPWPSATPVVREPIFRPADVDEVDMKLLWFYTASTSSSFTVENSGPSRVGDILKVRMVQLAFETPFLMDSLFALSCTHLQTLNQECDASRAIAYRARSFEGYRRAIQEARPETFPALVGNSLLMTALASQTFRDQDGQDLFIIDWMVVWRGIGLVIQKIGVGRFFRSGLAELFHRPTIDLEECLASIPNHLLFMISTIKPGDPDYPEVDTYYETLKYLGSLYTYLRSGLGPIMGLRIITWFTFLPRQFAELAKERRPRALVILAHYAVFLKLVRSVWWMTGIGHRSLRDLCEHLGPEWQHLIITPQMARRVDSEVELARIVLEDRTWEPPSCRTEKIDYEAPMDWVDDVGRRIRYLPKDEKLVLLDASEEADEVRYNR